MQRSSPHANPYWNQSAREELLSVLAEFVERHVHCRGLLSRMDDLGLGSLVRSWLHGSGHEPVPSEQLHAIFGTEALRTLAAKVNLSPRDVVRHMAAALPGLLSRLAGANFRFHMQGCRPAAPGWG